jgi:hypothetical protein
LHVESVATINTLCASTVASGSSGGATVQLASDDGAALASGDRLGQFQFQGADDASHTLGTGAVIRTIATETFSATGHGARMEFLTVPNTSTTATLALTLGQDQTATFSDDAVVTNHLFVGDTADANVTLGLTINQGANDDKIFTLKSSDVAHGMTDHIETDTFFAIGKVDGAAGGADLYGYKDAAGNAGGAIRIRGYLGEAADTTKSTSALGVVSVDAAVENGADIQTLAANSNIAVFRNVTTTKFILDSDGDSHQDAGRTLRAAGGAADDTGVGWTNYDFADDLKVLNAMAITLAPEDDPLRTEFLDYLESNRSLLESLPGKRLVTFNDDGHHFVNMSRLTMLLVGAMRQIGARQERIEKLLGGGNDERTIRAAT